MMCDAEREEVIKGLETCKSACCGETVCLDCGYSHDYGGGCETRLLQDAIALLKDDTEIIRNYVSVLQDITGNRMSKPNYEVPAILDCVRAHYCDGCDEKPEPRVMTLDEIHALEPGDSVWQESWYIPEPGAKSYTLVEHGVVTPEMEIHFDGWWVRNPDELAEHIRNNKPDYKERCWNIEPTDEQRKAVKWDD